MSGRAYILVLVGTLVAIAVIINQVRQRKLRAKYTLLWLTVGAALLPLAAIPNLLDNLASLVGITYPPALLTMMGLGFFALLSLHYSYELSRLEERTRVLAEEAALLRQRLEHLERIRHRDEIFLDAPATGTSPLPTRSVQMATPVPETVASSRGGRPVQRQTHYEQWPQQGFLSIHDRNE